MFTIALKDVHLHGYHGVFAEEALTGHDFIVNLQVQFRVAELPLTRLEQSVDYGQLYAILQRHFAKSEALLETICSVVVEEIMSTFMNVHSTYISIEKQQPPIEGLFGNTVVSLVINRNEK